MSKLPHPITQINFTSNNAFIIEASAGTGKTWTLERLYIKALLEGSKLNGKKISVENILVVTFTNEAVAELKSRIYKQIRKTIDFLFEIYSNHCEFSKHVLGDCDYETRLLAAQSTLIQDEFTTYLITRYQNYEIKKDIIFLNHALQKFENAAIYTIHGFCGRLILNYPIYFNVDFRNGENVNRKKLFSTLVLNFIREKIINNQNIAKDVDKVLATLNKVFVKDYKTSLVESITKTLPQDLFTLGTTGVELKYTLEAFDLGLSFLIEDQYNSDIIYLKTRVLYNIICYLKIHYEAHFRQMPGLSFDEMIEVVASSVANTPELNDTIYDLYPVAFIDEFQDTDNLQWQIFSHIYGFPDNKRGNLVVVGDPKQAIYSFRGADIAAYLQAKNTILTTSELLHLKHNFRSHSNIVNFVNLLFTNNQNNQQSTNLLGNDIDYHASIAKSNHEGLCLDKIKLETLLKTNNIQEKIYEENVQIVVVNGKTAPEREQNILLNMTFEILTLLQQNHHISGKIAILVSYNSQARQIIKYLKHYGIHANELKTANIYTTNTALNLLYIMEALIDLDDRKKLSCALINELVGIKIEDMGMESKNTATFKKYLWQWKEAWDKGGILTLGYTIIASIKNDFGRQLTNRDLANFWQLIELLHLKNEWLEEPGELVRWFLHKINERKNNPESEANTDEEIMRLDNDDEQIIVTTQHKAKGLEFDIVFCPFFRKMEKITVDEVNKQLPMFKSYYSKDGFVSQVLTDSNTVLGILNNEALETRRLNYVALTRAKTRLYIYLKGHSFSKNGYFQGEKPEKIVELFGYNKSNPGDRTHPLFNYPDFFGLNQDLAIKDKSLFPGVAVYSRTNLSVTDVQKLSINIREVSQSTLGNYCYVLNNFNSIKAYTRQSYTSIIHKAQDFYTWREDYSEDLIIEEEPRLSRYELLNDVKFSGATFGVLFHELCEAYPITQDLVRDKLMLSNVSNEKYVEELYQIVETAFSHDIVYQPKADSLSVVGAELDCGGAIPKPAFKIKEVTNKMFELQFNIKINNQVLFKEKFTSLLEEYFGLHHPFTLASRSLDRIEPGYLVGAIDLFFFHDNKYWVLDYKTNKLDHFNDSAILNSMAEHHYYLQYILYLVVIKRHLEQKLQITDASHLLGGSIYYYVRGLFTENNSVSLQNKENQCVYVDVGCQELIKAVDNLIKIQIS